MDIDKLHRIATRFQKLAEEQGNGIGTVGADRYTMETVLVGPTYTGGKNLLGKNPKTGNMEDSENIFYKAVENMATSVAKKTGENTNVSVSFVISPELAVGFMVDGSNQELNNKIKSLLTKNAYPAMTRALQAAFKANAIAKPTEQLEPIEWFNFEIEME